MSNKFKSYLGGKSCNASLVQEYRQLFLEA